MNRSEVSAHALKLPPEDRIELALDLWGSVEPGQSAPLSEAQKRLLEDRLEAYRTNPDDVLTWEEVEAELWPEG